MKTVNALVKTYFFVAYAESILEYTIVKVLSQFSIEIKHYHTVHSFTGFVPANFYDRRAHKIFSR